MHHEARGKECDFILQANVGSFYVLVLLVMCTFPANFLGDYSTSVEVSVKSLDNWIWGLQAVLLQHPSYFLSDMSLNKMALGWDDSFAQ